VQGEVQGSSGNLCAPRCDGSNYNCPGDMPMGASAQPQCMLQDADRGAYCGLLCQVDAQCPSGARCRQLRQVEVGLCLYPVSFTDWARSGVTKKLAVGWPSRQGGQGAASFQVAKTYTALQNLKQKYAIDDGDADMVTLKELLSSMKDTPAASGASSGVASQPAPQQPQPSGGSVANAWRHDLMSMTNEVSRGLPGLAEGLQGDIRDAENWTHLNALSELLRHLIIYAIIYLAVGSLIKYQTMGARGTDVIPHIQFWSEYPKLVSDGMVYSKMLVDDLLGNAPSSPTLSGGLSGGPGTGGGGAGAFERL